jgi:hypothetical protein
MTPSALARIERDITALTRAAHERQAQAWKRILGATYFECGADGLREFLAQVSDADGEVLSTERQDAIVAWAERTHPTGHHPCDPDRFPWDDNPQVTIAWRTCARYFTHTPDAPRPTWPETPAGTVAHLAFLITTEGAGAEARVADELVASGVYTTKKAK